MNTHRLSVRRSFSRKLTADLREVSHDKHLGIMSFPRRRKRTSGRQPNAGGNQGSAALMEKVNFGFEKVERMQGNIGYIEIRGFVPPAMGAETASAAMSLVAYADALIVDLRRNSGGEPAMIAYLLTYLFDEPTHLNDIYERRGEKTQAMVDHAICCRVAIWRNETGLCAHEQTYFLRRRRICLRP
jgi:hypothetical protein